MFRKAGLSLQTSFKILSGKFGIWNRSIEIAMAGIKTTGQFAANDPTPLRVSAFFTVNLLNIRGTWSSVFVCLICSASAVLWMTSVLSLPISNKACLDAMVSAVGVKGIACNCIWGLIQYEFCVQVKFFRGLIVCWGLRLWWLTGYGLLLLFACCRYEFRRKPR